MTLLQGKTVLTLFTQEMAKTISMPVMEITRFMQVEMMTSSTPEPVKITLRPVMATIRLILVLEMIKLKVVLVSIPSKRGLVMTLLLVD